MPMFRKKPVEIEARIVPDPKRGAEDACAFVAVAEWCGGDLTEDAVDGPCIIIDTMEGQMKALPGAYVIRGVKGEFYPCAGAIFHATYEPVEA